MQKFSHKELVEKAATWLQKTLRCTIVAKELVSYTRSRETPDAIGWYNSFSSYLVECKTSRSDFLSDKKKPARIEGNPAMGNYRIYLANPGVIKPEELPTGWSLIEARGSRIYFVGGIDPRKRNQVMPFNPCLKSESAVLLSIIRRSVGYNPIIIDSSTYREKIDNEQHTTYTMRTNEGESEDYNLGSKEIRQNREGTSPENG